PRMLWELRDDASTSTIAGAPTEGGTNEPTTQDLGLTWSRPVIGRIRVSNVATSSTRDFFVAIFGGGFAHAGTSLSQTNVAGNTGNFLYMVDIETGKVIYKRNLGIWSSGASGSNSPGNLAAVIPGELGVVDYNADGYLDRVFIADTQGRVFRVDLTATARFCSAVGSGCASATNQISTSDWTPTLFFDEYQ